MHDHTCQAPTSTADGFVIGCRYSGGALRWAVHRLSTEPRALAGRPVTTQHLRIDKRGSGKSFTDGTIDAWVLPNGVPVHVDVVIHGSQVALGSRVRYDEKASFDLTSATPRR